MAAPTRVDSTMSANPQVTHRRALSASGILAISLLALVCGHLLLKYYMPNPAFGGLGFILVGLIFYYLLFVRRDLFGFILVVYICSDFTFGNNQGGLWNLMAFGISAAYLLAGPRKERFPRSDRLMMILLGIFILWNVLGWVVRNPMPMVPELQGIAEFFGFILMFHLASNVTITKERVRLFLTVTTVLIFYQLLVMLNQRYPFIRWNTPLLGSYTALGSTLNHRIFPSLGTFRHAELGSEYGALQVSLLVPLLSSSLTQRELHCGSNRIVALIMACLFFMILTDNRSGIVLFVLAIIAYLLVLPMRLFTSIDRVGRQFRLVMAATLLIPMIGAYVGLSGLEHRFQGLASEKVSIGRIVSGKDINRGLTESNALRRIGGRSWFIGYGSGIPRSNVWALLGHDPDKYGVPAGFHSLYLSLPELYGWIGSLAFVSMIIVTWARSAKVSLRYRKRKSFLIVLSVGFTMFWSVFLTNEYKISMMRIPNYEMLFWVWLGLSNSVIKTIRYEQWTKDAAAQHRGKVDEPLQQGMANIV